MLRLFTGMDFPGSPDPDTQRQPAGYDFSLKSIAAFRGPATLDFSNAKRELPELAELAWPEDGSPIELSPGGYLVTYNETVSVPEHSAGILLPRSSLMRCGATLHSALWDPGYIGKGQGLMTVYNSLRLHRDARIAQFILIAIEGQVESLYSGQYQGENL
ncbi:MAG: deoxyuridine 5'-triphosphate nucleotidohydrolase [bacterium]